MMRSPVTRGSTVSRIISLQILVIVATSLLMPLGVFFALDRTVAAYQTKMLRQHEQSLFQAMTVAGDGRSIRLPAEVAAPYAAQTGGFAFRVLDGDGRMIASSQSPGAPLTAAPSGHSMRMFKTRAGGQRWFGASFPETLGGRSIWVQVAQDLENPDVVMDDVLARFVPLVGVFTVLLLLLLLMANVVIVQRAMTPILRASGLAQSITPRRPDVRLPLEQMPREIRPLVGAVNEAFDRLEAGFRAQRDLTADVAHELRTPLSVLRMRVEGLPEGVEPQRLIADIDAMSRTVSQLLAMAELESVIADPSDRADLRMAAHDVVQFLAPLAIRAGRQIRLTGAAQPVWVHGQQDFLFQALRNLVENAVAHTGPSTTVTVEVGAEGRVSVLDRGPGVPGDLKAKLFTRFWRRRRDRSLTGQGAGLGLSIVARIADSYAGTVRVEDRPGGGSAFILAMKPAT